MKEALRIGIAGLGTVGASVIRILLQQARIIGDKSGRDVVVTAVSARDRNKDRGIDLAGYRWFDDAVEMASSPDIDCIVEVVGGADGMAYSVIKTALTHGKHVVTANKALLAKHGLELAKFAEVNGSALAFEASVAGGIPIIKVLREGMAANRIRRIYGILNGTCNYILSRMELEKLTFQECLKDAQRLGYAEADPTFDVEGYDTAHKLALLASLAFGTEVDADSIYVEGISSITPLDLSMAGELGYRVKLLGVAEYNGKGIEQRVHPTMVPRHSAIAQVMGVTNAVTIDADAVKELTLIGPGAGGDATASAVVADITDVAAGAVPLPFGRSTDSLKKGEQSAMHRHEGGYYIRLIVHDRPGVAAGVATRMAEMDISLESILQKRTEADKARGDRHGRSGDPVPLVLITYAAEEAKIRSALDKISTDGLTAEEPQLIRIERE